jgi:DNA-binding MarR family transcriptional regulator
MFEKQQSGLGPGTEPMGVLVAAARRSIKQATGTRLRGSGLAPQQFWILMAVHEHRGLSLRGLCALRRRDAPPASRVTAPLAAKRLLTIGDDQADRRRCCLELTPKGAALARQLEPLLHELRLAIVDGLTPAEQETLRALLLRLIDNAARMERARPAKARVAPETTQETR